MQAKKRLLRLFNDEKLIRGYRWRENPLVPTDAVEFSRQAFVGWIN
jgi:hypothetical protein